MLPAGSSVHKVNVNIDPATGAKYIRLNGTKLKILKHVPARLLKPDPKSDKPPIMTKVVLKEYKEAACQTDMQLDCHESSIGDDLLLFLQSALNGDEPAKKPTQGFVDNTGLLRDLNDPKMQFYQNIKQALIKNPLGNMPIHEAVLDNNLAKVHQLATVLLTIRQSVNVVNEQGYTPLQLAVLNNCSEDMVKYLLSKQADIRSTDKNGNTVLHMAVETGSVPVLTQLCQHAVSTKQSIDYFNYDGWTPLLQAVAQRNLPCAKVLLDHEASVNVQDQKSGRTPLFHAAENQDVEMVRTLLLHHADTSTRNYFGTSPHDAMFELEDISQEIRNLIWASKKRKATRGSEKPESPKLLKMIKTYQRVSSIKRKC